MRTLKMVVLKKILNKMAPRTLRKTKQMTDRMNQSFTITKGNGLDSKGKRPSRMRRILTKTLKKSIKAKQEGKSLQVLLSTQRVLGPQGEELELHMKIDHIYCMNCNKNLIKA